MWEPGKDLDSFIPETHTEHVLCASHRTRLSSGNHSVAGVGFILEPEPIPCLSSFSQADVIFNRWNFLLQE